VVDCSLTIQLGPSPYNMKLKAICMILNEHTQKACLIHAANSPANPTTY
jgi:hypothetical protein